MQSTIRRADGLYYRADNIYNPWTADAALATQYNPEDALPTARDLSRAAKRAGMPQKIVVVQSALQLARAFSRHLRATLTTRELAEVIARNKTVTSPSVCHSHDFCDANVVALGALAELFGIPAERIVLTEDVLDLLGTAQDIAFSNRFFTAE
jgi:hypothetical protein